MPIVTDLSHIGVDARAYARGCRQLQAWHDECRRRRIAKKIREAVNCESQSTAIAAHNRVCWAVKNYKNKEA